MPNCFLGSSIKFQGHTGWKIDDLNPIWIRLLGRSQLSNPSDLPCSRSYVKLQGHTAQNIIEFEPDWAFTDCNSSLNSPMVRKWCTKLEVTLKRCPIVFSCDQAALWMVQSVRPSVCPSVRLSVCPSVCLSHLFDYVPIILSSWNFQELLPVTKVTSMQKVKVRGQRSRSQRSRPKFSFPDCNSSLNSHMMMKWYI